MPFFNHPRGLVFAHRGGSAIGPENTMAAFDAGLAAGADGLELDVRLSSDGVPVVIHDATLDRTTSGTGPVSAHTAAALARLDAACRFQGDGDFPWRGRGVGVPSLAEVLRRHRDCRVIVEMKGNEPALGSAVARVLRDADALDRVCAAGFGADAMRAFRRALPEAATSAHREEVRLALCRSWVRWPLRDLPYGGYQVPERAGRLRVVSPAFVRGAHAAGLQVHVWTVNDAGDVRRLLDWGVDALITDRPGDVRDIVSGVTPGTR